MRISWLLAVMFVIGCGGSGGPTTPAGPVGKIEDLRSKLKPDVAARAPTDDKATRRELETDLHGIKAKLVWYTWDDGANKYILSAGWEVVTPSRGITLEPLGTLNPVNGGTPEAVIETIAVRVRWVRKGSSTDLGEATFNIKADGTGVRI